MSVPDLQIGFDFHLGQHVDLRTSRQKPYSKERRRAKYLKHEQHKPLTEEQRARKTERQRLRRQEEREYKRLSQRIHVFD